MKTKQSRKPTSNELKTAINNLIMEIGYIQQGLRSLDNVLSAYIDYNKDTDKFRDWLKKQMEENESGQKDIQKSTGRNKETKLRNIKSKEGNKDISS